MSNKKNEIQRTGFLQSGYETVKALYNDDDLMTIKWGLVFSKYATIGAFAGAGCLAISDLISGTDYFFSVASLLSTSVMMSVMYANIYVYKTRMELIKEGVNLQGPEFLKEAYRRHNL